MTVAFLHSYGARVLVAFAVLLGLWGAYHYFRNQRVSGGFRSTYLSMAAITPVQGLLGLWALLAGGDPRAGLLHMVYGAVLAPGVSKFGTAGASWIVVIAFLRGISTG